MRMRWLRPQYLLRGRVDLASERSSGRSGSKSATADAAPPLRRSYLWAAGTALTLVLLHLLLHCQFHRFRRQLLKLLCKNLHLHKRELELHLLQLHRFLVQTLLYHT